MFSGTTKFGKGFDGLRFIKHIAGSFLPEAVAAKSPHTDTLLWPV